MSREKSLLWDIILWSFVASFIVFYPMLISIYVFLPLLIGFMGYVFILGIDRPRPSYILISMIYLVNLEVNLSLPLFLSLLTIILFYLLIYPSFQIFRKCRICVPLLSVIIIDLLYLLLLLGYDFVFNESSIVVDHLLLYSLVVDMILVFLL